MTQFSALLAGMHPVLALLLVAAILAVAMVPVYFLMILPAIRKREAEEAAKVARIELRGKPVYAWIVMAHDDLYKENQFGDDRKAQVIYTEEMLPNRDQTLATIAEKLRSFRAGPDATNEERRISQVIETQFPDYDPARLPQSVAGNLTVYTVSVTVPFKKLPERKLTRPYLWCKVLDGETDNVRMIDYPAGG